MTTVVRRTSITVIATFVALFAAFTQAPKADAGVCNSVVVGGAVSYVCSNGWVGGPGGSGGGEWPPTATYGFQLNAGPGNCFYLTENPVPILDGWEAPYRAYTYLWNAALTGDATIAGIGEDYTGPCPWSIDDIGPVIDAAWSTTPLPHPNPVIAPGRALAGLETYLVFESPREFHHVATTEGALTIDILIDVTATHDVWWGDGTVASDIVGLGVSWPGGPGEVTHTYQTSGTRLVTAEAEWSGTWDAGTWGGGNVNPTRNTPGSVTLPVQELQPVIVE